MKSVANIFNDIVSTKTRRPTYPHILEYLKQNKGILKEKHEDNIDIYWFLPVDVYKDLIRKDQPELTEEDLTYENRKIYIKYLKIQGIEIVVDIEGGRDHAILKTTSLDLISFLEARKKGLLVGCELDKEREEIILAIMDLAKTIMQYICVFDPDLKIVEYRTGSNQYWNQKVFYIDIFAIKDKKTQEHIRKIFDTFGLRQNLLLFGCDFYTDSKFCFSIHHPSLFQRLLNLID